MKGRTPRQRRDLHPLGCHKWGCTRRDVIHWFCVHSRLSAFACSAMLSAFACVCPRLSAFWAPFQRACNLRLSAFARVRLRLQTIPFITPPFAVCRIIALWYIYIYIYIFFFFWISRCNRVKNWSKICLFKGQKLVQVSCYFPFLFLKHLLLSAGRMRFSKKRPKKESKHWPSLSQTLVQLCCATYLDQFLTYAWTNFDL